MKYLKGVGEQHFIQFHRIVEGFLISVLCLRQYFPSSCKSMRQEELTLRLLSKDGASLLSNKDNIFHKLANFQAAFKISNW